MRLPFCAAKQARYNRSRMKSAYELAMERLEKSAPTVVLTAEQKEQVAEIDSTYKARIAEKELFLRDEIRKARGSGALDEAESLEKQLAIEVRRLQEDCEAKKEKLRQSFGS
jgi:Ser-tRNA(Ala) deacylase AlaX